MIVPIHQSRIVARRGGQRKPQQRLDVSKRQHDRCRIPMFEIVVERQVLAGNVRGPVPGRGSGIHLTRGRFPPCLPGSKQPPHPSASLRRTSINRSAFNKTTARTRPLCSTAHPVAAGPWSSAVRELLRPSRITLRDRRNRDDAVSARSGSPTCRRRRWRRASSCPARRRTCRAGPAAPDRCRGTRRRARTHPPTSRWRRRPALADRPPSRRHPVRPAAFRSPVDWSATRRASRRRRPAIAPLVT